MSSDVLKAPFPYFGGKSRIAAQLWQRLGNPPNYVEPFAGSCAALLARPGGAGKVETVNDCDGLLVNFWRAVAADPLGVAGYADYPVSECDLFARHLWLVEQKDGLTTRLMRDPLYHNAKIAGWWVWGACAWLGSGWCSGDGPWTVQDGALVKRNAGQGINRQLPHLSAGRGINRQLPHLGNAGRGTDRAAWLTSYFASLQARLREVRVACGDWQRVLSPSVTTRHGLTAVLFDPPYGVGAMDYAAGGNTTNIAADVWAWAEANGDDPLLRIAVCGYEDGRVLPNGWTCLAWKAAGGYAKTKTAKQNSQREVVFFSPHCIAPQEAA